MAGRSPPSAPQEPSAQELAAAIHETTNALTVILGWIERARAATEDQHDAQRALARAGRYTRDARASMRRAIGAELPPRPPERAASVAERASEDLAIESGRASVDLVLDVGDACWSVLVPQPDAAWQILTNLLLNAVAVTPARGTVTLSVTRSGDDVVFRVRDDGPGIPEEMRDALFSAGISRRAGGAGIGLRHAYNLAADCGGTLGLGEAENGRGAVFDLRWPATEAIADDDLAVTTKRVSAPKANLAGARVLLLEDDARVIELLELSLGARGAEVTSVKSAEELTKMLDTHPYDVMLVDLSPLSIEEGEATGLDAAVLKARGNNPDIDVVVISGSVTVRPRNDVVWVRKPFEPKELVDAILKGQGSGTDR